MIELMEGVSISDDEIQFKASRSSGPGGQNVNKVNSRVTLQFSILSSSHLTDEQKHRIASRLRSRVTRHGVLTLHCQLHRSQTANRRELLKRFATMLCEALAKQAVRKKAGVPRVVSERRLEEKKQRGTVKQGRRKSVKLEE